MKLTIKYFGLLAEVTGCEEETLTFQKGTVADLLSELYKRYPGLKDKDFQLAHALEIADENTKITDSEIALLPPFSGG